jgi:hypothetical protein
LTGFDRTGRNILSQFHFGQWVVPEIGNVGFNCCKLYKWINYNVMPKDSKTADRFAKLVIAELADIHAVVQAMAEFAIADMVVKTGITLERAQQVFEDKRCARAEEYCADLLKRLNLGD